MIRLFDIFISLLALVLLAPLILLVSLLVWIDLGRPIFFLQERRGIHGKNFSVFKFRTMKPGLTGVTKENKLNDFSIKVKNDPRITKLGRVLRNTSIDEVPQLLNVLKGNMSIVGPRPFMVEEYNNFPEAWFDRTNVKPGITGLAQINGRSDLPMESIIELDMEWQKNKSLLLYFKIILKTVVYILRRKNTY